METFKMMNKDTLKRSLSRTAAWFENSGIMVPADGSWGVAERVLLTDNNTTKQKTFDAFPAWTNCDAHHSIIEQRRADCNFEAALMFLLMGEALENDKFRSTGEKILDFLYCRSGLLLRNDTFAAGYKAGMWQWSHIWWVPCIWWDDNSWVSALQFKIARLRPDLDKRYDMTQWGLKLAHLMAEAFLAARPADGGIPEATEKWSGNLTLPHWGSMMVMALAEAWRTEQDPRFAEAIDCYHRYLLKKTDSFTTSELGYAVIGAVQSSASRSDALSREVAECYGRKLLKAMDPETGNIAAQHYEAPVGEALADTIYTLNWAVLALQNLAEYGEDKTEYRTALEKLMGLLLKIQDNSPEPWLNGCWRGMFDLNSGTWGGGDCFEGGASSIYTGWTNAPIAWAVANELSGRTLAGL